MYVGVRVAKPVEVRINNLLNLRIVNSLPIAGGAFPWYEPLAGLSLRIAIVTSDCHGI